MHLLRTVLAKSAKDSATMIPPFSFPKDTSRLQKHVTIVVKRLAAGGSLLPAQMRRASSKRAQEEPTTEPEIQPIGSAQEDGGSGGIIQRGIIQRVGVVCMVEGDCGFF